MFADRQTVNPFIDSTQRNTRQYANATTTKLACEYQRFRTQGPSGNAKVDIYDVGWPRRSQTRCREAKPLLDKLLLYSFIKSAVLGSWTAEANGKPNLMVQLRMRFPSLENWIYVLAFVKYVIHYWRNLISRA